MNSIINFNSSNLNIENKPLKGFGDDLFQVTNNYLIKNGEPWIPTMGEFHFSRYSEDKWKEELLKIKEGGIEVVATYVFWIHHEEEEGNFIWTGNRDVRRFISLCHELGLLVFLRSGPWSHGECRNGGFPDWIVEKCKGSCRHNAEPYLTYVRKYLLELSKQIQGLKNIIGIQVENEKVGDDAPEHLIKIKEIMQECGMSAPLFTATGWGSSRPFPTDHLLPAYGGYPDASWAWHTKRLEPSSHFFFTGERDDGIIGNDLLPTVPFDNELSTHGAVPFLTCETGCGLQVCYHRRPIIHSEDVYSFALACIGNGCNLLGYYVYHGGKNPVGALSTMQESKDTGYPNDMPAFSYDYQAPLGECGQIRESYTKLKDVHCFLSSFGKILAPMPTILPDEQPIDQYDTHTLRCAVRTDGHSGFIFVNNYQRLDKLPSHHDVTINIKLKTEQVSIPIPYIQSGACFIMPFNLQVGDHKLLWATAQPLSIENNTWTFRPIPSLDPYFNFEDQQFVLTEEPIQIGGVTFVLEKAPLHKITIGKEINTVEAINNQYDFSHFDYLHLTDHSKEWKLNWEGHDYNFLKLHCNGNIACAYYEGKPFADYFLFGTPWIIDVRSLEKKELTIKIQPLSGDEDIYFDAFMPQGAAIKKVEGISESTVLIQ